MRIKPRARRTYRFPVAVRVVAFAVSAAFAFSRFLLSLGEAR